MQYSFKICIIYSYINNYIAYNSVYNSAKIDVQI